MSVRSMKNFCLLILLTTPALVGTAPRVAAAGDSVPLIVTSSNAPVNALLVYSTSGTLVQTVPTGGQGGGGNAGGIATRQGSVAVVNFLAVIESNGQGQSHLTQFSIGDDGALTKVVSTAIGSAANGVGIVVN